MWGCGDPGRTSEPANVAFFPIVPLEAVATIGKQFMKQMPELPARTLRHEVPMKRYSVFAIAREALRYHTGWEKAWRSPEPKAQYDAIVVGAGGHGLATAYYLGKNHGITNVAIIERAGLAVATPGGIRRSSGRTICRIRQRRSMKRHGLCMRR